MSTIKGKVFKYGNNINTDVIFPGKYTYTITDPQEIAKHSMEDLDPEFVNKVKPGDVVIGGTNFGCGSSREQAASCLKYIGVGAIIAKSFSRLYFRNCLNFGLPPITCAKAVDALESGDDIEVDLLNGKIITGKDTFDIPPLPESIRGIINAGGLIPFTRKRLGIDE
ncbi:MAG: 3-isopropylmalate dehydratase [candidate division Zixibacteria bacterium CG_4_9_14_3_um_filter_46_8]|nr:MAG: 3-isopropylmalate dehydratase [candidate division Zixibacteria bacterium CG_4_9_14_3_um_filter_46_8]